MKPPTEEQIKLRSAVLDFLQGGEIVDSMVVGFSLVIEVMDLEGASDVAVLSADAAGRPPPYHRTCGHVWALDNQHDFDIKPPEDD